MSKLVKRKWAGGGEGRDAGPGDVAIIDRYKATSSARAGSH